MQHNGNGAQWFAERSIRGVGDDGAAEIVTIWIERKPGALWAGGRGVGDAGVGEAADAAAVHWFVGRDVDGAFR